MLEYGNEMRIVVQDVRYSLRLLRKKPLYTAVVLLTLSLGIAGVTAVVSLLNVVLLEAYGPVDTNRWVYLWEHRTASQSLNQISVSIPNFRDWKAGTTNLFTDMVVWLPWAYTASGPGISEPERVRAAVISPEVFSSVAAMPAAGRWLTAGDARSSERRVVLSYGFWTRVYGADPKIPGKTIRLNGAVHTVVGIAPQGFSFPPEDEVDVWTALPSALFASADRAERGYRVAARLRPGVTPEIAQSALNVVTQRLANQNAEDRDYGAVVVPMREGVAGDFRVPLIALSGAVGFALILLCLNIGYLRLVHLEARTREIAVRLALGATRLVLVRQLLIETMILFLIGGGFGILLAPIGVRLLLSNVPAAEIPWLHAHLDWLTLAGALVVTAIATILCGLLPLRKTLRPDVAHNLTAAASTATSGRTRWRGAMIAGQIALAFIPLYGAGLLMRSFVSLQEVELGFRSEHRLTFALSVPKGRYAGPAEITALANDIRQGMQGIPGLKRDALAQAIPFAPGARWLQAVSRSDPRGLRNISSLPLVRYSVTSPGYFEAMGIPLKSGRTISESDTRDAQPIVVINEKFARLYFPSEDPIGKVLWIGHAESLAGSPARVIAGVVGDSHMYAVERDPDPAAWVPMAQQTASDSIWRNLFVVADQEGNPSGVLSSIRERIRAVDPDLAIADVAWMDERVSDSMWRQRLSSRVLEVFSLAALGIAVLGTFGVTSYLVALRGREIGIRMAVGAKPADVRKMVVSHSLVQVAIGLALGLAGAAALARLLQDLLFGVRPGDPFTFAVVAAILALAAVAASLIPAHRAARFDPLLALRSE